MVAEYEHLAVDLSYAALRVISREVRKAINGTTDMTVQTELNNFANECDNRIQHHDRDVQRETIAALNAAHKNPAPIVHRVVTGQENLDDLI